MKSRILACIDYQDDFVTGALGFEQAKLLENKIVDRINEFKKQAENDTTPTQYIFAYTLDTHNEDYLNTHEGRNLPITHCVEGTAGHCLHGKVGELIEELKLNTRVSVFGFKKKTFPSLELGVTMNAIYSKGSGNITVELMGLVTDKCVISNAIIFKAALPDARIILLRDYMATLDKKSEEATFTLAESLHMEVM